MDRRTPRNGVILIAAIISKMQENARCIVLVVVDDSLHEDKGKRANSETSREQIMARVASTRASSAD